MPYQASLETKSIFDAYWPEHLGNKTKESLKN